MKKVESIIRPENLDKVRMALQEKGILGMTVEDVHGRGRQHGMCLQWRAGEYRIEFLEKIKVVIILEDKDVEPAISAIIGATRTGNIGDGKIFISPIEEVIRISTGERGKDAI